eukprot:TRINITY_DN45472_c0_g1_i1.p1 TRINITY_DN45472_c0_g1~~TRINITY_DN45472_c0_g1_i1.p1  ORF type:complete len:294 (+),score=58.05 TRINITY_DN45472_c0_g1_i1:76-957(+)
MAHRLWRSCGSAFALLAWTHVFCMSFDTLSRPRAPRRAEENPWQDAYLTERERNRLLLDELKTRGLTADDDVPEASSDWQQSYAQMASCNSALEKALRDSKTDNMRAPSNFKVVLRQGDWSVEKHLQLVRFFSSSAFFLLRARLPLGLQLVKRTSGHLQGAFEVEDVLPGGTAVDSGLVLPGDVLQAVSAVKEGEDRSGWTDAMSSFMGGLEGGSLQQTLIDTAFINTLDDLIEKIQQNKQLGPEIDIVMIFERNTAASPAPAGELLPMDSEAVVSDWTDGIASPTRSTDLKG